MTMKWIPANENWEDVILYGKHLRMIESKEPVPYRAVAKSESFGNKWLRCWCSPYDIESIPAERVEYFDESSPYSQSLIDRVKVCVGCGHVYGDDLSENKSCCPDSKYLLLKEFIDNWLCDIINIKTENANLVRYDYNHVLKLQQRISELEKERDELKVLISDMGKHTNEVVCKHNILVEEIEALKK